MTTAEKRNRLLVAVYRKSKSEGFDRYINILPVADSLGVERDPGELRLWVKDLEQTGKLEVSYTLGGGSDGGMSAMLTAHGLKEAEHLVGAPPDYGQALNAPTLTHIGTADVVLAVAEPLSQLRLIATGSNSINNDDRQIALAEIAVFEAALVQPVVATDLVSRFVEVVLKWIGIKFADGAASAVIAAIILNLAPFLKT